ncbi:hypothetical protein FGG08_000160 [Glutinoglossum americanum]|uniref:DUF7708 domain-containing protein n=1 Tax=Glutinoglossum americanum TaxID=1670608 RepID=A0A9P8IAT1_9PEZI|nr:hypothetical protein FGG08_000160 [Glutinoglossum americanum]
MALALNNQLAQVDLSTALRGLSFDRRNSIATWYAPECASESLDIARNAYDAAVQFFSTELTNDECKRIWLSDKTSMYDVEKAVVAVKKTYDSSKKSKAGKWVAAFATRVTYYGSVMDILAQHHPEYVALVWGAMKFCFVAMINHEELLTQIAKWLSKISNILPRTELCSLLYPTEHMKEAVACLYARIIRFLQQSVKFYTRSKFSHAWNSVVKPYALSFREISDEIEEYSRRVDQLAAAASQAEIRGLHLKIIELMQMMNGKCELLIHGDLQEYRQFFCNMQLSQILGIPLVEQLPNPDSVLDQWLTMRNRRRRTTKLPRRGMYSGQSIWLSKTLEQWAQSNDSSLLFAKRPPRAYQNVARDFIADVVEHVRSSEVPVVWALQDANSELPLSSHLDVLRILVLQILKINPEVILNKASPITAARFQCARTEAQWLELLETCLTGLDQIYVVIDAQLLWRVSDDNMPSEVPLIGLFQEFINRDRKTRVKMAIAGQSWMFSADAPSVVMQQAARRTLEQQLGSNNTYRGRASLQRFLPNKTPSPG